MQKGLSPHVKYDSYWGHVNHYGLRVAGKPFTYLFAIGASVLAGKGNIFFRL